MCCIEMPSACPTLSNSCERPSSGSISSNSSAVPKRSFIVFSYSRRFSRRSTVPFAAACACTSRGSSAERNAVNSLASGRSVTFFGGISPAVTRSKIRSHFTNVATSERSRPSFSRSNPPFAAPSPWQSKQCASKNAAVGLSKATAPLAKTNQTIEKTLRMNSLQTTGHRRVIRVFCTAKNG